MKRYIAEIVGTFVLAFGGCGAAVFADDKIGFAGVAVCGELLIFDTNQQFATHMSRTASDFSHLAGSFVHAGDPTAPSGKTLMVSLFLKFSAAAKSEEGCSRHWLSRLRPNGPAGHRTQRPRSHNRVAVRKVVVGTNVNTRLPEAVENRIGARKFRVPPSIGLNHVALQDVTQTRFLRDLADRGLDSDPIVFGYPEACRGFRMNLCDRMRILLSEGGHLLRVLMEAFDRATARRQYHRILA
jgi:hypothetical protein